MYGNFCASCHMDDGSGLRGRIPPLANSDYLKKYASELACIIRYGKTGEIEVNGKKYQEPMPGVPQLTDFEIANIINIPIGTVRSRLHRARKILAEKLREYAENQGYSAKKDENGASDQTEVPHSA